MTTIWTGTPSLSAASINELREAVDDAEGTPAGGWTGGSRLPEYTTLIAEHILEIKTAIQLLWDERCLGLIPNWRLGVEPGEPIPGTPLLLIRDQDIYDLRKWFNHYETWGDLRGVHWWKDTRGPNNNLPVFPRVGWNVETVVGVTKNGAYQRQLVDTTRGNCESARNYGLVNIVRIDWKEGHAVPTVEADYNDWKDHFFQAVNALKDVATIFIVGNEPTKEPGMYGGEYAAAFDSLYGDVNKVAGVRYLAAGPAAFGGWQIPSEEVVNPNAYENDLTWLRRASEAIAHLDGWALHTYGSPYLDYADRDGDECVNALCDDPAVVCRPTCGGHTLEGDAGFQRFRQYLEAIRTDWAHKPVYFTETNTSGFLSDQPRYADKETPAQNYITGWIQETYQEIRKCNTECNSNRDNYPPIMSLCWFVDDNQNGNWGDYSLSNDANDKLRQARADFIASDTSTGITEPSRGAMGPDPERVVAERSPGINTLCGTVA